MEEKHRAKLNAQIRGLLPIALRCASDEVAMMLRGFLVNVVGSSSKREPIPQSLTCPPGDDDCDPQQPPPITGP